MKLNVIPAVSRGNVQTGWLTSFHTYSFGSYFHPSRMGFGALRVINDDTVAPDKGFGTHPHNNMEIITIPTSGTLRHVDSMGNETVIQTGEVQAMSAGTGITHSEMNGSAEEEVKFFQIWVETREQNIEPAYSQKRFEQAERNNRWQMVVSPNTGDAESVKIFQDAWFVMGDFAAGKTAEYQLKNKHNGVFVFVIEGVVGIDGQKLHRRDGVEISETEKVSIEVIEDGELLVMEVPLD
jgi:redox-sensitive bicupin YhaK (pirin superfamily)